MGWRETSLLQCF